MGNLDIMTHISGGQLKLNDKNPSERLNSNCEICMHMTCESAYYCMMCISKVPSEKPPPAAIQMMQLSNVLVLTSVHHTDGTLSQCFCM